MATVRGGIVKQLHTHTRVCFHKIGMERFDKLIRQPARLIVPRCLSYAVKYVYHTNMAFNESFAAHRFIFGQREMNILLAIYDYRSLSQALLIKRGYQYGNLIWRIAEILEATRRIESGLAGRDEKIWSIFLRLPGYRVSTARQYWVNH